MVMEWCQTLLLVSNYVLRRHQELKAERGDNHRGSVATISLAYERSRSMDTVIRQAIEVGVYSLLLPGMKMTIIVRSSLQGLKGQLRLELRRSRIIELLFPTMDLWTCVDIFAPGQTILSTWVGNDTATTLGSGTSMATPHLAGLLAYYLALQPVLTSGFNSGILTPKEFKSLVFSKATRGALSNVPSGTVSRLSYNGADEDNEYFHTW
ncbi:serine protease [Linnemannia exigua]|uniref:Serine protease n=1 Tax=Linnemannia exigua TaxID=604196 RepID=A0AAD4DD32_9FUNG|nr:serine protease [Linnemannia exigua]